MLDLNKALKREYFETPDIKRKPEECFFSFLNSHFILNCMYACLSIYTHVSVVPKGTKREHRIQSVELGVTGSWELPDMALGTKLRSSTRTASALNH